MGILAWFRPKWKHAESDVRLGAVTRLCNYSALAWVIRNDPDPRVRGGAIERLDSLAMSDQSTLADVARNHSDAGRAEDRGPACEGPVDPGRCGPRATRIPKCARRPTRRFLHASSKTDPDPTVRNSALARLEDQAA